jgi:hypothetical protein
MRLNFNYTPLSNVTGIWISVTLHLIGICTADQAHQDEGATPVLTNYRRDVGGSFQNCFAGPDWEYS